MNHNNKGKAAPAPADIRTSSCARIRARTYRRKGLLLRQWSLIALILWHLDTHIALRPVHLFHYSGERLLALFQIGCDMNGLGTLAVETC
jgi:hypothetical protein